MNQVYKGFFQTKKGIGIIFVLTSFKPVFIFCKAFRIYFSIMRKLFKNGFVLERVSLQREVFIKVA